MTVDAQIDDTPAEANPDHCLPNGRAVGERFELGQVLGTGGFGVTYRAWDRVWRASIALKEFFPRGSVRGLDGISIVVNRSIAEDFPELLRAFLREASLLHTFSEHPTIVAPYCALEAHGTAYLAYELLEGATLSAYLNRCTGRRIPFATALDVMAPIARALDDLHRAGVIHRDICPDNIFIVKDGGARLIDFGAAHRFREGLPASRQFRYQYSPPEQLRSSRRQGPWCDVFALAATIYHLITGAPPAGALERTETDSPAAAPLSAGAASMSPSAEAALLAALSLKPAERPASIADFWRELTLRHSPVPVA